LLAEAVIGQLIRQVQLDQSEIDERRREIWGVTMRRSGDLPISPDEFATAFGFVSMVK
jgi:hypothetical protein